MESKTCFKCGETKPLADFYKHSQMADGRIGKCKSCNKADVIANRLSKVEYYRSYDRERGSRQTAQDVRNYREANPNKHKAHGMVARAIRSGKLFRELCEVCSELDVHAHHDDYSKPLNIRWLCPVHHKKWHDDNGSGANG